jgi:hypothetical protein
MYEQLCQAGEIALTPSLPSVEWVSLGAEVEALGGGVGYSIRACCTDEQVVLPEVVFEGGVGAVGTCGRGGKTGMRDAGSRATQDYRQRNDNHETRAHAYTDSPVARRGVTGDSSLLSRPGSTSGRSERVSFIGEGPQGHAPVDVALGQFSVEQHAITRQALNQFFSRTKQDGQEGTRP